MKRNGWIKKKWISWTFAIVLVMETVLGTTTIWAKEEPKLYARSALLMDASNGRVLFEENGYESMPIASTTKILTCILALEYKRENEERIKKQPVICSAKAARSPKVHLGMRKKEAFWFDDLLYSLMLASHNDTAVALAEYIDGSVACFAERMNKKAKELGCQNSYFLTPNGLDANEDGKQHASTAYDLALISRYAITNDDFVKLIQTRDFSFSSVNTARNFSVHNHNLFLDQMEGAFGIKTGFTSKAGYCFVGALRRDDRIYIGVVLACGWPPNKSWKWKDINALMQYGLDSFQTRCIKEKHVLVPVPVENGIEDTCEVYVKNAERDADLTLLLADWEKHTCKVKLMTKLSAPVLKDQKVGTITYFVQDTLYKSYDIYAKKSIKQRTYYYCVSQIFMLYF